MKLIMHSLIFFILTVLTQVGGIVYLFQMSICKHLKYSSRQARFFIFVVLYLLTTFVIVPLLAPKFGRVPVEHTSHIKAARFTTVLLNRNYIVPQLNEILIKASHHLANNEVEIRYLDANFPFINHFPLLPHLSHNDGRKIDLSLIYETSNGQVSQSKKSISGYGVFEHPIQSEVDQITLCKQKGYTQYDYPKYLSLGSINEELVFSKKGTKLLIDALLKERISKIFIEPHLKTRMHLGDNRVRYHGCRAVRHDDHIHVEW
jgi:hypothetical protein